MPSSFIACARSVSAMVLLGFRAATKGLRVWSTAHAFIAPANERFKWRQGCMQLSAQNVRIRTGTLRVHVNKLIQRRHALQACAALTLSFECWQRDVRAQVERKASESYADFCESWKL